MISLIKIKEIFDIILASNIFFTDSYRMVRIYKKVLLYTILVQRLKNLLKARQSDKKETIYNIEKWSRLFGA